MDASVLVLAVFVLGYLGAMIYIANLDDLARLTPKPASDSTKMFGSQELAAQQRSTILRWMQYCLIAINLIQPPFRPRFRDHIIFTSFMPMPKATMYKNDGFVLG